MGTTPKNAWPYPELTDPPDGAAQIKALALAIEATFGPTIPIIQNGNLQVAVNNVTSVAQTITFPRSFAALPSVAGNINSQSSTMSGWTMRCTMVTTTAFTLLLAGAVAVTYSPQLQWLAGLSAAAAPATLSELPPLESGWHYATVTCHTPGCPKAGEQVPGCAVPDVPADWGWTGICCGACGQPITDIVPT